MKTISELQNLDYLPHDISDDPVAEPHEEKESVTGDEDRQDEMSGWPDCPASPG